MDLVLILICIVLGAVGTLAAQWYLFQHVLMSMPYVGPPERPKDIAAPFSLPQVIFTETEANQDAARFQLLTEDVLYFHPTFSNFKANRRSKCRYYFNIHEGGTVFSCVSPLYIVSLHYED